MLTRYTYCTIKSKWKKQYRRAPMEHPKNESIRFYANKKKVFRTLVPFIIAPALPALLCGSLTVQNLNEKIFFIVACLVICSIPFVVSYFVYLRSKTPPIISVYQGHLTYPKDKYGNISRMFFSELYSFFVTNGKILNLKLLVLITKNFKKKHTLVPLSFLNEEDALLLGEILKERGLIHLPPNYKPR